MAKKPAPKPETNLTPRPPEKTEAWEALDSEQRDTLLNLNLENICECRFVLHSTGAVIGAHFPKMFDRGQAVSWGPLEAIEESEDDPIAVQRDGEKVALRAEELAMISPAKIGEKGCDAGAEPGLKTRATLAAVCAVCAAACSGEWSIEAAGPGTGGEVPLCATCGDLEPRVIWAKLAARHGKAYTETVPDTGGVSQGQPRPLTMWLPVARLVPSGWQTGRRASAELVDSMKSHGFDEAISRLLVRPLPGEGSGEVGGVEPGKFQIIAGECRWDAAQQAGLKTVACVVLQGMDDAAAQVLHYLENRGRQDLTAMQEAEAIGRMLSLRDAAGQPCFTCRTLCEQLGVTEAHVGRMARVAALGGDELARREGAAGRLGVSHLTLIAGLPTPELRDQVTAAVLNPPGRPGETLNVEQTRLYIAESCVRHLQDARFNPEDPDLVPAKFNEAGERFAGGKCSDCPSMTKNLHARGGDAMGVSRSRSCIVPACFRAKEAAEWAQWQREVLAEKRKFFGPGQPLEMLDAAKGAELFDHSGAKLAPAAGRVLVEWGACPEAGDLRGGVEVGAAQAWSELTNQRGVPIQIARVPATARAMLLMNREAALAAACENGHAALFRRAVVAKVAPQAGPEAVPAPGEVGRATAQAAQQAQEQQAERAAEIAEEEAAVEKAQLRAAVEAALAVKVLEPEQMRDAVHRLLWAVVNDDHGEAVAGLLGLPLTANQSAAAVLGKHIETVDAVKLPGLLVALSLLGLPALWSREMTQRQGAIRDVCKSMQVDAKRVAKEAKAQVAAERDRRREEAAVATGLEWEDSRHKVDEFGWEEGVATKPTRVRVALPAECKQMMAAVFVARRSAREWHSTFVLNISGQVTGEPQVSSRGRADSNRTLAAKRALEELRDQLRQMAEQDAKKAPALHSAGARVERYMEQVGKGGK